MLEPCHQATQYGQTDTKRANSTKAITGSAMEKQKNSSEQDESIRKTTESCDEIIRITHESCDEIIRKTTESCDENIRKTAESSDDLFRKINKRCASYKLIDQTTFPLNPLQTSYPVPLVTKSAINRNCISKGNAPNLTSLSLSSTIKRRSKQQDSNSKSFDKGSTIECGGKRKSLRMIMIAFLVCLIFVLSWLPPWLIFIVNLFLSNEARSTQTYSNSGLFCKMAYLINSFTNPILYTVLNKNFRENLRTICASD